MLTGVSRITATIILGAVVLVGGESARAQIADHPVITEVYPEPPSLGGPVGRNPADSHQEFIEIYIPTLADLGVGLDKDALNVTLYDVEGDATSPGLSLVNYRIDLPTFDLDPSNGMTGLARPSNGVVVLGWVDYVGNPPTDLAGTPSTRLALVNGGVTSTADYMFIPINGNHFTGTTNFPTPVAVSHIDTVSDPLTGKIEQGSGAFLLVNRDDPGYAQLCGQTDPAICNSFPNLPSGTTLGTSSLLDAFAINDDSLFRIDRQPYSAPTGDNIDLEFVLPAGGAFSLLAPQYPEGTSNGYQRYLADVLKTTEDGIPSNEDPALDAAAAYLWVSNLGPFYPTPGLAPLTTSAASLSLADDSLQVVQVLTNTNARPGINAANLGGDFGMDTVTTPGASSTPLAMTFAPAAGALAPIGNSPIGPPFEVQTFATTPVGHMEVISVGVTATASGLGDPPIQNPTGSVISTISAINPTTGINHLGLPYQATAFFAVHGIPDQLGVANEFLATSLGQAMSVGFGTTFTDSRGNGLALINPLTNLNDPLIVDPMIATMPADPLAFINPLSASSDLVTTVLGSPEMLSGAATYDDSFNLTQTLVQAREFITGDIPTTGGFTPTERIHYADATGRPGVHTSGFTSVVTARDFELALIDTNLGPTGVLETGETDDFGIVVRVAQTRVGASVATGEFIFLSTTGGRAGADLDTLNVPPFLNQTEIVYVDLDPLDTVLGVESIDRVYAVDGSGNGEVDILDVIKLPEPDLTLSLAMGCGFLAWTRRRRRRVPLKPVITSGVSVCIALITSSCATVPPDGCRLGGTERVDLEAVDGEVALRLVPRGDSIRVEGRDGSMVATVRCDKLGLVVGGIGGSGRWLIQAPEMKGRRYYVKSMDAGNIVYEVKLDPDGDIEIRDSSGSGLSKVKRRDYGYKVVSSDGEDLARVRSRPGKISVRDENGTTYLTTRSEIPLEAAALLIVESLPVEVAAGVAVAVAHWGFPEASLTPVVRDGP